MYSDKAHINYLTSILLTQGITDIVVCPGARNAPLCHNFHQAGFTLHPVTDERSAAFVALGIYLETKHPTIVCVTSGSALLNTLPTIAEAFYRHIPLIAVSADRPEKWIGQLDGQTIPQKGALQPYAPCINIAANTPIGEFHTKIANALLTPRPVHINVEIEEPLFNFNVNELPHVERAACAEHHSPNKYAETDIHHVAQAINDAKFPLLMMGQLEEFIPELTQELSRRMAILPEVISNAFFSTTSSELEVCIASGMLPPVIPDLVIHIGGPFICKQMKQFLRKQPHVRIIRIGLETEVPKTFGRVDFSVRTHPVPFLKKLVSLLNLNEKHHKYWVSSLQSNFKKLKHHDRRRHEISAIQAFCASKLGILHVANSSSVRWLNSYFEGGHTPVFCNRGVNGIEGTLSTAAGHSLKTDRTVGCIIGDLSFFYDSNALWNQKLGKNLVVLLLNNSGGAIFYNLHKLHESPALNDYIAAQHTTTAKGICNSYNINYVCKESELYSPSELTTIVNKHIESDAHRPLVIEIIIKKES